MLIAVSLADYIPLITTIVASVFTILLIWQYAHRRKIHQAIWTLAMALYAVSAFMEYLANPDVMGPSVTLIKIYYVCTAPLVGLLGSGVLYLLVRRKVANAYLAIVVILSLALLVGGGSADLSEEDIAAVFEEGLREGFGEASTSFPFVAARLPAILLNSTGGTLLIGGALYSYVRDRSRTYNIFLILGGLFPFIGGTLLGIFHYPYVFFEFELAGTVFLFLGFVMSMRYLRRRERR
ncbi:MAG: hypothetical protein ACE5KU_03395, partial [Nitrososphaerales archaeon]